MIFLFTSIDTSYNLFNAINNNGYAIITGNKEIGSASKSINIIDNTVYPFEKVLFDIP